MTVAWADVAKKAHRAETVGILQRRSGSSVVEITSDLALESWSINVDGTRAIRRQGSAVLADPSASEVPLSALSNIAPYGVELKIRQRLIGLTGETSWQTLITMVLDKPRTDDPGWIRAELSGNDRAAKVSEARLTIPYTIAAGTNVATAIEALISSRVPGLTYSFTTTTATTPLLVLNEEDDPWQRAQEMASAAGLELYFDPEGVCTLRVPPDPANVTESVTYEEGQESILTNVGVILDTELSYSHAVFIGEGPDETAPVRADAFDDDPLSPTYYLGPFGDKPVFLRTTIVSPDPALAATQAVQSANALLNRKKGAFKRVTFEGIPIPTLEASDLVRVTRLASGVDQLLVLDSFSLSSNLGDTMPATTRAVRI